MDVGLDVSLVDGQRVRRARELRQLSQSELAAMAGTFTPAALSQIERGHSRPTRATLSAIAAATGMPPAHFLSRPGDTAPRAFFRGLRSMPSRTRKAHLAHVAMLHELVRALARHVRLPEVDVPRLELADFGSIDEVARLVRGMWRLPAGPIDSVVRELERHGCVVVRQDGFEHSVDAYSVRFPDHCIVVLGTSKGVTTRSRFDASHELAHLVLHGDDDVGSSAAEKQAQAFASAFLMPREDIEDELPRSIDFDHLLHLKLKWRVSMQALLYRSRSIGVLPEQDYTTAMKSISARGWRRDEPGDSFIGALEEPTLLRRAADLTLGAGTTLAELASEAALPVDLVQELLDSGGDSRPVLEI